MSRRMQLALLGVLVLVLALAAGSVTAQCGPGGEEFFYIECGYQCDQANGIWSCYEPNPDRCCVLWFEFDACGEMAREECPQCVPGGCGF